MKEALYDWGGLNAWLFARINGAGGNALDAPALFFSALGDPDHFKYFFGLTLAALLLQASARKARKREVTRLHLRDGLALLIALVMGYAAYGFLVGIMKAMLAVPRPFMVPELRAEMHFLGPYPDPLDYNAGFPCPHTATAAFLVSMLWYKLNHRAARFLGIALAALVAWSRIAIGMHFPADVLAGALLGAGTAWVVRRYVYRMMRLPVPGQAAPPPPAPPKAPAP